MLSYYYNLKTQTPEFRNYVNSIMDSLLGKKVIIYGAGSSFFELNKQYDFCKNLNIICIADKKFKLTKSDGFQRIKTIPPEEIKSEEFDYILVSNEYYEPIVDFLHNDLSIENEKIKIILKQEIKDERKNLNYLHKHHFEKTLPKLVKRMKDKKIIIYGAGALFCVIDKYFDLSGFNILAVSDKKFEYYKHSETVNYPICSPSDISERKPDCILVATKLYMDTAEYLYIGLLRNAKIKVLPLVQKSILFFLKEG